MTTNSPHDRDRHEREFVETHASAIKALRDHASQCPHPDLVSAAVMGVLPVEDAATVNAHITACSLCSILAEGFRDTPIAGAAPEAFESDLATDRVLGRIRKQIAQEQRPARSWFGWPLPRFAAAAAAIIIVVGLAIFATTWKSAGPPDQIARVDPAPPVAPVYYVPLEPAELKLPLDAIMWRGTGDSPSKEYFEELGKALAPYNKGEFAAARETLTGLAKRYPANLEPYFYLGVSNLLDGHAAEARAALEKARQIATPLLAGDIDWYLAIANERDGRSAEAAALLDGLCNKENVYRERACSLLPRFKTSKP